jgi:nucleoside-diphosphate-sugar epimerase
MTSVEKIKNILVTGSGGFIGSALCPYLQSRGFFVRAALRDGSGKIPQAGETVFAGELNGQTDWKAALSGIDAVVHCAGRAHVLRERHADPLAEFRRVNVEATRNLAVQAAAAGVKRFIFLSTVKVNGENSAVTKNGAYAAFSEDSPASPLDGYALSKFEAEQVLCAIGSATAMETVVLRLPLVYGPGVKANFKELLRLSCSGLPIPLGSLKNRRSLLYLENGCDCIARCITEPAAAGQLFLVSDGDDLSTPELIRMICRAAGRPSRLLPCPLWVLKGAGMLTGKSAVVRRLTGSLCVNSKKLQSLLGWRPPVTSQEGIRRTVQACIQS